MECESLSFFLSVRFARTEIKLYLVLYLHFPGDRKLGNLRKGTALKYSLIISNPHEVWKTMAS